MSVLVAMTLAGCGGGGSGQPLPSIGIPGGMPGGGQPYVPGNPGGYQGLPSAIDHGPQGPARVVMKNVRYRVGPTFTADVPALDGVKIPVTPGAPIVMDDPTSFSITIHNGAFALDGKNMSSLMNDYVFNYPDAPLKEQEITLSPGRLNLKGKLKMMGMEVPFEMEGPPKALANGKIELVPDKIKAVGLPQQGLMKLIGLEMDKLVKVRDGRGLYIDGNAIIMDPTKMLPPPAINGQVTRVSVGPDPRDGQMKMHLIFGNGPQAVRDERLPAPQAPNYMHIWGGTVRFVNTTSTFTNLQIVDADPSDPFDFYLNEYGIQMVQGVIMLSPMGWTLSVQPDYTKRHIPVRPNLPGILLPSTDNGFAPVGGHDTGSASRRPR